MNKTPRKSAWPAARKSHYEAVIFAGGGCRCFWQAGFWSVFESVCPEPRFVLGVSAGAAFACSALLGRGRQVLEDFKGQVAANERNFYPRHLMLGRPLFPHERIYRNTISSGLRSGDFERLRSGPDLRILLARPPRGLGGPSGFVLGGIAYALDRYEHRVHARWANRLGFGTELISVRDCSTQDELVDLILHSSCTPPLLPLYRREDRIVLDGGLVDNAPAAMVPESCSTLVLLTRHYDREQIPAVRGRTYVWPSQPVPVVKWDYTSPELVQRTFDLGCRDGETFAQRYQSAGADGLLDEGAVGLPAISA